MFLFTRLNRRSKYPPVVNESVSSPTGVICVLPTGLVRPGRFKFLSVQVPSDHERHHAPEIPAHVLNVYDGIPMESEWGRDQPGRAAEIRLEYLRAVDANAHRCALTQGLRSVHAPPRIRS